MNLKNAALAALVALVVGLGAFGLTRWLAVPATTDEMAWLQREFRLTPAQADKIDQLHAAYEPVCMEHCRQIVAARQRLQRLADRQGSGEYREAIAEMERLQALCAQATRRHLEAVAGVMAPAEGRRYLELVGPKLSQHDAGKPFGLK